MSSIHIISLIAGILCGALLVIYTVPIFLSPAHGGETLFIYGTLQNEFVRFVACRCFVSETPATLVGYRKVKRTVVPAPGESVNGSFITIDQNTLKRIDQYEKMPGYYRRVSMEIDGRTAWVYIKNEE